jgi:hypothetical protein
MVTRCNGVRPKVRLELGKEYLSPLLHLAKTGTCQEYYLLWSEDVQFATSSLMFWRKTFPPSSGVDE